MREYGFKESEFYAIAQRAYELALQGAYDQAAVLLEGLNAVDPTDRYSLITLAAVRLKQHRPADAAQLLEHRLKMDPADGEARYLLLEAYMDENRRGEAEREWTRIQSAGRAPGRLEARWRAFLQSTGQFRIS